MNTETLGVNDNDLSRKTLEALAIESYREGELSIGQLAELLELSVLEAEDFLHSKNVPSNYSSSDLEEDIETLKTLK